MSISFGSTPAKTNEPKYRNKGYLRGQMAYSLAATPASLISIPALSLMKKASKLSQGDSIILKKAAQEGLKRTGLLEKGVRAYSVQEISKKDIKNLINGLRQNKENPEKLFSAFEEFGKKITTYSSEEQPALEIMKKEVAASKRFKRLVKIPMFSEMKDTITDAGAKSQGLMFKLGMNAAYFPHGNGIITPSKTLQTSIFHEMGHALNNNGGVILKTLQKMRPMAKIVPAIVITDALLNKRKTTDEKLPNNSVKNVIQNVRDGIKKHAGLISAAAMLPMVVEEGIASLRGQKLAKGLVKDGILSKDLFKKIKLTNLGGFTTYAATMVGIGLATKVAVDVKDKIQAKYEQKKLAKFQARQEKAAAKRA